MTFSISNPSLISLLTLYDFISVERLTNYQIFYFNIALTMLKIWPNVTFCLMSAFQFWLKISAFEHFFHAESLSPLLSRGWGCNSQLYSSVIRKCGGPTPANQKDYISSSKIASFRPTTICSHYHPSLMLIKCETWKLKFVNWPDRVYTLRYWYWTLMGG